MQVSQVHICKGNYSGNALQRFVIIIVLNFENGPRKLSIENLDPISRKSNIILILILFFV